MLLGRRSDGFEAGLRVRAAPCVALAMHLAAAPGCFGAPADRPAPLLDARTRPTQYLGPGREEPPPADLKEIRLAFFGPADPNHPEWGEAWRGASLAIEDANASGGYQGLPFRLEGAWSDSPWGSGVADLARLVFDRGVWAIVGGVDGATTHLAEQVAVKARLALVSPGGSDPSVNFTNVPWMFTLLATDDVQAPLVAGALGARRRFSVVTTADHDAASAWRTIGAQETMRSLPAPILQLAVDPSSTEDASRLRDLARGPSESVLVLAPPRAAARIVRALRAAGFTGALIGGATLGRRAFSEEAGAAAEGVLFPLLFDADCPEAAGFVARYRERFGSEPDYLAAHAHDAARLLVAAVRSAGPNRALIRDALAVSPQTPGAAGAVTWDPTGRNTRPPALGIWHDGRARRVAQGAATTSPE